jgi:hypothetical protein
MSYDFAAPPSPVSKLSLSSVFLCVAGLAYFNERGGSREEVRDEPNYSMARKPGSL